MRSFSNLHVALMLVLDSFIFYHNITFLQFSRNDLVCSYTLYIALFSEQMYQKDIACIICSYV